MLNTILLAIAAVLILRALRVRIEFKRIPFPDDAPRGLAGLYLSIVHVPRGVHIRSEAKAMRDPNHR